MSFILLIRQPLQCKKGRFNIFTKRCFENRTFICYQQVSKLSFFHWVYSYKKITREYLVHYRLPTPTQCSIRRSSERFSFSSVKINIIFLSFLLSSLLFEWNKIEYGIPISNLETHEMIGSYSFGLIVIKTFVQWIQNNLLIVTLPVTKNRENGSGFTPPKKKLKSCRIPLF